MSTELPTIVYTYTAERGSTVCHAYGPFETKDAATIVMVLPLEPPSACQS